MPELSLRRVGGLILPAVLVSTLAAQTNRTPEDFVLALGYVERGLHSQAIPKFERFLERHPRHARASEAWYRLGVCRLETNRAEQGIVALRKAVRSRDFELIAEARYRLGTALQEKGELDAAASEFGTLVERSEDDHYLRAAAFYGRGECLRDLGRDEPAIDAFLDAAEAGGRNGGDGERYAFYGGYQAGFALLRLERFQAAERLFGALAQRQPNHEKYAEVRYFQGDAAYRAKNFDAAESAWRACVERGGEKTADALYGLAWCRVDRGDKEGGLRLFERLIEQHPRAAIAKRGKLEVGRLLHEAGNHRKAARVLEPLLRDAELGAQALEVRAAALLASGDTKAARASYESVASSLGDADPRAARLQYGLGESLAQSGKWREALNAYERAAQAEDPELRGDARYAQVVALHELADFAESARRAAQLIKEQPKHRLAKEAAFARAENLFALERYVAALDAYERLGDEHPRRPVARFKAAWSAFLGGDAKGAAPRFEALVDDAALDAAMREEALSLLALTWHEAGDAERALRAADRYHARYPNGGYLPRTERIAGRVLRARGELDAAAQRFERASRAEPDSSNAAELELEQADVLFEQGDFDAARKRYRAASKREDRAGARAIEGLAWCAFELGDDPNCLRTIERGRSHPGVDATIQAGLDELAISVFHRGEKWTDAIGAAQRFLREHPEHERVPAVRYALGVAQARGGRAEDARDTLRELSKVERSTRVFYELAWACKNCGDVEGAKRAFERVAQLNDDPDRVGEALLELSVGSIEDDPSKARAQLAKVTGAHRGRALYRLGFSWVEEKRYHQAAKVFEELAARGEAEPLYWEARFMVGECSLRAGDHARALEHLGALLKREPKHERAQRARLYVGECAVRAKQPAQGIAALDRFLGQADDATPATERARANLWLGRAHADRGEADRAEQAFTAATSLSVGEVGAEAQFRIGETRYAAGDREAAIEAFMKLSILFAHEPWVPRGLARAAECYDELDQPEHAKKFRKELRERYPNSDEAKD